MAPHDWLASHPTCFVKVVKTFDLEYAKHNHPQLNIGLSWYLDTGCIVVKIMSSTFQNCCRTNRFEFYILISYSFVFVTWVVSLIAHNTPLFTPFLLFHRAPSRRSLCRGSTTKGCSTMTSTEAACRSRPNMDPRPPQGCSSQERRWRTLETTLAERPTPSRPRCTCSSVKVGRASEEISR